MEKSFNSEFNKKLNSYLTVYKTPIAPDSLDPTVFYFPETGEHPRLHPGVHAQITNDVEMFVSGQPARVKKYVIVGDVVTPGKNNKRSEIKVLIVINKDLLDVDPDGLLADGVLKLADSLSGKLAVGTLRPIRYVPMIRDIDSANYNAIYDIPNFNWIKTPSGLKTNDFRNTK
jgi:hypothetical protein